MPSETTSISPNRLAVADPVNSVPNQSAVVETFTFDVSAGKKLAQDTARDQATFRLSDAPDNPRGSSEELIHRTWRMSSKTVKRVTRTPAWLGSMLINAGFLAGMSLVTISSLPQGFDFTLSFDAEPVFAEEATFADVAIDPLQEFENAESQLTADLEPTTALSTELADEIALANFESQSLAENALNDAANLFASKSGALADLVPSGEKLTASFFGTKVEGRRILYVLDNSGGMRKGGLETLIEELLRSVDSLTPKQQFYVVFYSDMVYQLFHPHPPEKFVPANDRNKQRLRFWLDSVEFCVGNSVDKAIQLASMIRPDAVYLLTDGDVDTTPDGRKLAALVDNRGRDFPIHTFLIGKPRQSKASDNLRLVAESNEGTFRMVEVSEEAEALAREKNRPYHNKEPGPVWGLNVGGGWGR